MLIYHFVMMKGSGCVLLKILIKVNSYMNWTHVMATSSVTISKMIKNNFFFSK